MTASDADTNLMNGEKKPGWALNVDPPSSDRASLSDSPKEEKMHKREQWANKIDFLLACIGFSVGLGNVWRFPFLCYRNGGGAFLIPYFIAVVLGGIPVFFLEVSLGQFMSEGGIGPWKICPLFQGVGYACAVIVFFLNCDYNIILTWAFYYLFSSFTSVLPWIGCDHNWNTVTCSVDYRKANGSSMDNVTFGNVTEDAYAVTSHWTGNATSDNVTVTDPVTEFWERKVLHLSSGVGDPGRIKWDLALCLLFAWIVVYFCIWKGIRSSGKVMYFTATSPYILMLVLMIRGLTLEGAMQGVKYYLLPEWSRLLDPQVWVDAGTQIFFSYSISLGTLTALGSYNKFNHNCFKDSIIFAAVNSGTSLLAGLVIFSVLGFMAHRQGVSIADVAESGPGLAFIAYPEAIGQMPVSPLWSCLFFMMVILLGLDSQFVGVEGFITFVVDLFPNQLRRGYRREVFIALVCALCFFIGLSMVTEGGMYVFQLFDYYSASRIVLVVAFFECIVVSYCYGVNRFYDNLQMMLGFRVNIFMKLCWAVFTPLFTMIIFIMGCVSYSELTYKRKTVTYEYPSWAIAVGWMMASMSVIFIPIIMVVRIVNAEGSLLNRLRYLMMPQLRPHQIRPNEDMTKVTLLDDVMNTEMSASTLDAERGQTTVQLLATNGDATGNCDVMGNGEAMQNGYSSKTSV